MVCRECGIPHPRQVGSGACLSVTAHRWRDTSVFWIPYIRLHVTWLHSIMARPRNINFSSELKYYDTKQFSNKRDSVVSTDLSTNEEASVSQSYDPAGDSNDVKVIMLRDRSGLSLALQKLKCGSDLCSCYDKQLSNPSINSANVCCGGCQHLHQVKLPPINCV